MNLRPGDLVAVQQKPDAPDDDEWGPGPWIARVTHVRGDTISLTRYVRYSTYKDVHASEVAALDEQRIADVALMAAAVAAHYATAAHIIEDAVMHRRSEQLLLARPRRPWRKARS